MDHAELSCSRRWGKILFRVTQGIESPINSPSVSVLPWELGPRSGLAGGQVRFLTRTLEAGCGATGIEQGSALTNRLFTHAVTRSTHRGHRRCVSALRRQCDISFSSTNTVLFRNRMSQMNSDLVTWWCSQHSKITTCTGAPASTFRVSVGSWPPGHWVSSATLPTHRQQAVLPRAEPLAPLPAQPLPWWHPGPFKTGFSAERGWSWRLARPDWRS